MKNLMLALVIALATLLVVTGGVAWWQHGKAVEARADATRAQTNVIAADFEASAARADVVTVTHYTDRVRIVHDTTHANQQEIPHYVSPDTDRRYPFPAGFVWLHDAAAAGVPVVDGPGNPDAPSTTVTASGASAVIIGNYGICHETAEQLTALQEFVRTHTPATP